MSELLQWVIVGVLVAVAAVLLWRIFRRDPCAGCAVADVCKKKNQKSRQKDTGGCSQSK